MCWFYNRATTHSINTKHCIYVQNNLIETLFNYKLKEKTGVRLSFLQNTLINVRVCVHIYTHTHTRTNTYKHGFFLICAETALHEQLNEVFWPVQDYRHESRVWQSVEKCHRHWEPNTILPITAINPWLEKE